MALAGGGSTLAGALWRGKGETVVRQGLVGGGARDWNTRCAGALLGSKRDT